MLSYFLVRVELEGECLGIAGGDFDLVEVARVGFGVG